MNILELFINTANNIYLTSNHTLFSSLSDMEVGSIKSVVKELYDLGLCSRCILRFIDERDTSLYEGDYEVIFKIHVVCGRASLNYGCLAEFLLCLFL